MHTMQHGQNRSGRLLGRARHELHRQLAERGLVRLRRGRRRARRRRPGVRPRGLDRAGPRGRCRRRRARRPEGGVRGGAVRPRDQDERALRGQVPARLGALTACHRPGGRRDRRRDRRRGRRPRLHRQGQRPAALRALVQGERPGTARDRAAARPDLDARRGDRVRHRQRDSGRCDAGFAVLDRREPLRARDRGRRARGSLGRAAGGALRAHRRPGRRARAGRGHRSASRQESRSPSTAKSCGWPS